MADYGNEKGSAYGQWGTNFLGKFVSDITGATRAAEINSAEAAKQRNFEAHKNQIMVEDMKAAGLNPALMYGSGGAAPSAVSASAGSGSGGGIESSLINSAANLLNANDNTKNKKTQNYIYNTAGQLIKTITTNMK